MDRVKIGRFEISQETLNLALNCIVYGALGIAMWAAFYFMGSGTASQTALIAGMALLWFAGQHYIDSVGAWLETFTEGRYRQGFALIMLALVPCYDKLPVAELIYLSLFVFMAFVWLKPHDKT